MKTSHPSADCITREVKLGLDRLKIAGKERIIADRLVKEYGRSLNRIACTKSPAKRKKVEALIFSAHAAKVCAVVRAWARCNKEATFAEVVDEAQTLNVREPLKEIVTVWWEPKDHGKGFRMLCKDGPKRTAQRLLLRDALELIDDDSAWDYSRRGGGGERGLIQAITKAMEDCPWWVTSDIKDCFPSLRPGHFGWLDLDRRVIKNTAFLPKCVKLKVLLPEDSATLPTFLGLSSNLEIVPFTTKMARQGLSQGAVSSPALARRLLGRAIRATVSNGIFAGCYCDDLAIGAPSRQQAELTFEAIRKRLFSLPAGPIVLRDGKVSHMNKSVQVLGYVLEPGNGVGGTVHVKPGAKRTSRFRRRLASRLQPYNSFDTGLEVGLDYWRRWYASQTAWTKVPEHSAYLSETITICYVDDYFNGIPMGGG